MATGALGGFSRVYPAMPRVVDSTVTIRQKVPIATLHPDHVARYCARISGWLLERIEMEIEAPTPRSKMSSGMENGLSLKMWGHLDSATASFWCKRIHRSWYRPSVNSALNPRGMISLYPSIVGIRPPWPGTAIAERLSSAPVQLL